MTKYLAPALDKGLDILEYLSQRAIPLSQSEIAQGINKTPNEIYRMLVCLEQRGYLQKSSAGKYSISLKLYQLSHRHSPVDGLIKAAKPYMEELSNATKQSCHMSIIFHGQLMVVSQTRSPGPVSLSVEEGSLFPLIKTTSGRVMLALIPAEQQMKVLKSDPDFSALKNDQQKELLKRFEQIKKQGYEVEISDITIGVSDIAITIGKYGSGIYSALAISSLTSVIARDNCGEFLREQIQKAAASINEALGY